MASVEGYAEHVMDAAAGNLGAAIAELRAGLDARRRNRSVPVRILSWLFGFELKLRQYEQGKRFCDAVVATAGIAGLNGAWERPEALPDRGELTDPDAWIERVLAPGVA
jgi:putative hydrolase